MLQRNGEDIASKSVFNEANLKEHLRGKTADELIEGWKNFMMRRN